MWTITLFSVLGVLCLSRADPVGGWGEEAPCRQLAVSLHGYLLDAIARSPGAPIKHYVELATTMDVTDLRQVTTIMCAVYGKAPSQIAQLATSNGAAETILRKAYGVLVGGIHFARSQLSQLRPGDSPWMPEVQIALRIFTALDRMGFSDIDPQAATQAAELVQIVLPDRRDVERDVRNCSELRAAVTDLFASLPTYTWVEVKQQCEEVTGLDLNQPRSLSFVCLIAGAASIRDMVDAINEYGVMENVIAYVLRMLPDAIMGPAGRYQRILLLTDAQLRSLPAFDGASQAELEAGRERAGNQLSLHRQLAALGTAGPDQDQT